MVNSLMLLRKISPSEMGNIVSMSQTKKSDGSQLALGGILSLVYWIFNVCVYMLMLLCITSFFMCLCISDLVFNI